MNGDKYKIPYGPYGAMSFEKIKGEKGNGETVCGKKYPQASK